MVRVPAGDGYITLDEFVKIMTRPIPGHDHPDYEEAELIAMFQEMDGDGSGHVDYHEFAERWALDRELDEQHAADLEGEGDEA